MSLWGVFVFVGITVTILCFVGLKEGVGVVVSAIIVTGVEVGFDDGLCVLMGIGDVVGEFDVSVG